MTKTSHHNGQNHPRARRTPCTRTTPQNAPTTAGAVWVGRAWLTWARLLQHTVAGEPAYRGHVARRNRAMRAAHGHGIHRDTITARIGLSHEQVRQTLRKTAPEPGPAE